MFVNMEDNSRQSRKLANLSELWMSSGIFYPSWPWTIVQLVGNLTIEYLIHIGSCCHDMSLNNYRMTRFY